MIAHVKGQLSMKTPQSVVVDVGGVGYKVFIPLSTYSKLPETNSATTLLTVTFVKDDSIELYGFLTPLERELFSMLTTVSGIGPKLARNILSGASVEELKNFIAKGDIASLKQLPGVGKKTAERVIVELKEKVGTKGDSAEVSSSSDPLLNDIISALKNLGYKAKEAESVAINAREESPDALFEELLKKTLRKVFVR